MLPRMLLLLCATVFVASAMEFKYHTLEEVNAFVHHVASEHGSLVTLQYLGNTIKGASLFCTH